MVTAWKNTTELSDFVPCNSFTSPVTDVGTSNVSNMGKIVASSTTIKLQDKKCAVRSISVTGVHPAMDTQFEPGR